jgi:hypothetical protein
VLKYLQYDYIIDLHISFLNNCALLILSKEWNKSIEIISSKITLIISDKLGYSSWWLTSIERLFEIKRKFENGQRLLNEKFGSEIKNYKIFGQTLDTLRKLAHEPPHDVLMSYGVLLMKYEINDSSNILVCELCNEIIGKYEHICDCSVTFEVSLDWFGSQFGWEKTRHEIS